MKKVFKEFAAFVAMLVAIGGVGYFGASPASAQISNPSAPIVAGTGLTKTGNTLSVNYGTSSTTALRGDTSSVSTWATTGALTAGNGLTVTTGTTSVGAALNVTGTTTLSAKMAQQSAVTYSAAKGTLLANTSAQAIDSWGTASFFSAHYTVIVKQNTAYQVSDFLVVTDGATAALTLINTTSTTGSALATFSASISAGTVTVNTTYASGANTGSYRLAVVNTQA